MKSEVHHCPVPNCTHISPAICFPTDENSHPPLHDHLTMFHSADEIAKVSTFKYSKLKLHPCRECHCQVYATNADLQAHHHLVHRESISETNLEILQNIFSLKTQAALDNWTRVLIQFSTEQVVPFSFCNTVYDKLNKATKSKFYATFNHLLQAALASSKKRHTYTPTFLHSSLPLHRLVFQFHALILAPLEPHHTDSISQRVCNRLKLFCQGHACGLLDIARRTTSLTPAEKAARTNSSPIPIDAAAQAAADAGNAKGALKLILRSAPPALYNDSLHDTVLSLYPRRGRQAPTQLDVVWDYMLIFATNNVPNKFFEEFSAVWLTLLYKQWPIRTFQDIKHRPIGAGTGLRRCITAIIAKEECHRFARACLASNNFGVGVRGGSHFVAFTLLAQCQKYVFKTKAQLAAGDLPSKCLLSLDLTNMFNRMSREKCRQIL
mmetsp:Transcript_7022/g.10275  ORF Transcript_7022/g.10275 Transcript_7022/m.10275 type:complete len:437 (+) Transcript_7022:1370-2680(+)